MLFSWAGANPFNSLLTASSTAEFGFDGVEMMSPMNLDEVLKDLATRLGKILAL